MSLSTAQDCFLTRGGGMTRITILSIFWVIIFNICSIAQSNSCQATITCAEYSLYESCMPPIPPGAFNCGPNGPFSEICSIQTYQCAPTPCPTCGPKAGGPIDLATGNTDITQSDIRLPGLGGGLTLTRTWNSQTPGAGIFGLGWSSTLEERVYVGSDGLIKDARGDGSIFSFGWSSYTPDGKGSIYLLAGPSNGGSTLQIENAIWTLTFKNGDKETFSQATGALQSIVDRNGNTTQLSYDSNNHLVAVADPASRHLYFAYSQIAGYYLATSVTSDFGVSLSFQYDNIGRLTKAVKPDNTFVTFEYGFLNFITAVKDSGGKLLESHTYDVQGRGLTSSRAGNVDSISVSY